MYLILSGGTAVIAVTLPFVHTVKGLFIVWIAISFTFFGGHFAVFPTVCAKIFGPVTGGKVYPIVFFAFSVTNIIGVVLSKTLISSEGDATDQYHIIFWVEGVLACLAFVIALFLSTDRVAKKHKTEDVRTTLNGKEESF